MQAIFMTAVSSTAWKSVDDKWSDDDDRSISESPVQLYVDGSTLYIERVTFLSDITICIGLNSTIVYETSMLSEQSLVEISLEEISLGEEEIWIIVKDDFGKYVYIIY